MITRISRLNIFKQQIRLITVLVRRRIIIVIESVNLKVINDHNVFIY